MGKIPNICSINSSLPGIYLLTYQNLEYFYLVFGFWTFCTDSLLNLELKTWIYVLHNIFAPSLYFFKTKVDLNILNYDLLNMSLICNSLDWHPLNLMKTKECKFIFSIPALQTYVTYSQWWPHVYLRSPRTEREPRIRKRKTKIPRDRKQQ